MFTGSKLIILDPVKMHHSPPTNKTKQIIIKKMLIGIIRYYHPSARITTLLLIPVMLCTSISYMIDGAYSLKSTPNDRFLGSFFIAILYTLRYLARNLLRGRRRRNIFIFRFDVWPKVWTPALRLINQHAIY